MKICFAEFLLQYLTCTYDSDEELKLDIFNAISVEDVFIDWNRKLL